MIPEPAVIHCTSPPERSPVLPRLSLCSTVPSSTYVIVSIPLCGCHGNPALYFSGSSFLKSSNNKNGSNFSGSAKPNTLSSDTPAPSRTDFGFDLVVIGLNDI